jgi:hypothetical protein
VDLDLEGIEKPLQPVRRQAVEVDRGNGQLVQQFHVVGRHDRRRCLVIAQLKAEFRGLLIEFGDPGLGASCELAAGASGTRTSATSLRPVEAA